MGLETVGICEIVGVRRRGAPVPDVRRLAPVPDGGDMGRGIGEGQFVPFGCPFGVS